MTMIRINKILFLVSCILLTSATFGQSKADTLKQKHNESVTIYGSSRPVTGEALKIGRKPQVPTLEMSAPAVTTGFPDIKVPTTIQLKEIRPASNIQTTQQELPWKNLLTLGLGSRISPLLEYFYSGGKPKKYLLTVHLFHHSSFLNIKNYFPSPYTRSLAGVSFDKFFRYHVLSVRGGYQISTNRFYGHNTKGDTLHYDTKDPNLKQYYQTVSFGVKYASSYRYIQKLQHTFRANGYFLSGKHGLSETHYHFDFNLHKGFRVSQIFNHQQLGLESAFDYYQNKTDKAYLIPVLHPLIRDYYVRILPYFDARYGIFSFKIGINFEWLKRNSAKLHLYPYLHVNVNVAPGIFSFFAGIDGGLKKSSLQDLSRENPFLSSLQNDFRWENTKFEAYGGFRGNIARKFGFEVRAGYRRFSDMPYFDHEVLHYIINLLSNGKYFPPINDYYVYYANGHVFNLSGSLTYASTPNLNIWFKGEYHRYSLEAGIKPLYKPLFTMRLGASYLINKRIKPWIEGYYMNKQWASRPHVSSLSMAVFPANYYYYYYLSSYFDINLGVDYHIDKQLTGFIRVTNMLNKQYYRFDQYPVAGLEIMVGVRYRF